MAKGKFERLDLASKSVTFIIDDQDEDITYLCDVKKQNVSESFFQNTWTEINSVDCGAAWFQLKFNGTRAHISSRMPNSSSPFAIQVDGSPLLRQHGSGLYDTPILEDGEHTVVYAVGNTSLLPAFDYATVTAGPSTNLRGKSIIVDDIDTSLEYTGNWAVLLPDALALDSSSAPYQNTTHWTSTVGDAVRLKFAGTSISVYRTIPRQTLSEDGGAGNITVRYILDDGRPTNISFPMTSNQPLVVPMSRFLQLDSLSSDTFHTLELSLAEIPSGSSPQPGLGLDFITYTAGFEDLNSMPSSSVGSMASRVDVRTVVGGVLGGFAGFFLLVALIVFGWKRHTRNRKVVKQQVLPVSVDARIGSFDSAAWAGKKHTKHESVTLPTLGYTGDGKNNVH